MQTLALCSPVLLQPKSAAVLLILGVAVAVGGVYVVWPLRHTILEFLKQHVHESTRTATKTTAEAA